MSGLFDDDTPAQAPRVPPGGQQRSRALVGTIIVLVAAFFLVSVFTGVWTDRLWFASVDYSSVFTKVLGTKVLLFLVFGLLMAVVVGANVVVAYRFLPARAERAVRADPELELEARELAVLDDGILA